MIGRRCMLARLAFAVATSVSTVAVAQPASRLIAVEPDVKLEVVDWGGTGKAVVLLAGLGNTAHDLGGLAGRLTPTYHVYGITRRGFGASSAPATGYAADRLADDVLAVIDSLGLVRPVLAGHSIAGQELSSIGSRHPEKVAGLIYLDAGYGYAFYDRARGDYRVDLDEARRHLEQLDANGSAAEARRVIEQLLATDLPALERALRERLAQLPPGPAAATVVPPRPAGGGPTPAVRAILAGEQRYTEIRAPVLAIYALPHRMPPQVAADTALARTWLAGQAALPAQAQAFERGVPTARVVRIPNADHYVFESNPVDVVREMRAFIAGLPHAQ
jgi:non-heme chloroperoxidase